MNKSYLTSSNFTSEDSPFCFELAFSSIDFTRVPITGISFNTVVAGAIVSTMFLMKLLAPSPRDLNNVTTTIIYSVINNSSSS